MTTMTREVLLRFFSEPPKKEKSKDTKILLPRTKKWVPVAEALKAIDPRERLGVKKSKKSNHKLALVRSGTNNKIMRSQLLSAFDHQRNHGGLIEEILVDLGLVKEEDIAQELTTHYGFPYLPLDNYDINLEAVRIIPRHMTSCYCSIPIEIINNNLTVVMANPLNTQAIEDIKRVSECRSIQIFVSTISSIKKAIEDCYSKI